LEQKEGSKKKKKVYLGTGRLVGGGEKLLKKKGLSKVWV